MRPHARLSRPGVAAHTVPVCHPLGMDARRAVGAARGGVDFPDALEQTRVIRGPGRGSPALPRVVPADGDPQKAAHRGDRIGGPVGSHELEENFELERGADLNSGSNEGEQGEESRVRAQYASAQRAGKPSVPVRTEF